MAVGTDGELLAGRYRVIRTLGRGGMAVVLLAEDERLGRQVAVKRLHTDSPEDIARRFTREARVGASLNHPNIVTVYDTVADEEGVLIVMEYVEGGTLADALRAGRLPTKRALGVVRDVAAALDHVHHNGVVHRDVKPANVLTPFGGDEAKLTDLGIATIVDDTRITRTGIVLGTPAYMAPEQLEGGEAGPAVDIYALAAMTYEAMAGKKARTGRSAIEIAHQVANGPPPDLRDDWPDAPRAAAEALKRGMANDPGERHPTAAALAQELDAAFEERAEPTRVSSSPPVTAPTRRAEPTAFQTHRGKRDLRTPLAIAGVVLVALVVAGIALLSGGGGEGGEGEERAGDRGSSTSERSGTEAGTRTEAAPAEPDSPAAPAPGNVSAAEAQALQKEGRALNQQGRFDEAIPKLEQARDALKGSKDPFYYFALYELGVALNGTGRSEEAIPILEERLTYDSQRDVVQAELDKARAGGEAPATGGGESKGNGKAKGKKGD
ncbi:MAG: serine/threonine protein kinase [Thermoleophilaceae bacterium]|nr:serine/threonine protein kinase [Thermoleophilaceae bacterium]